jgi:ATP-dependent Lon protease
VKLPTEVPVMTLPNATLFPQALLPLYIFEPRYRQMLAEVLAAGRVFAVAMQKPGRLRETPTAVAGLGVVRVSVGHKNGTSHLILQGLARVELQAVLRYKPYRVQRVRVLETPPVNTVTTDALVAKVRELLTQRLQLGLPFPFPTMGAKKTGDCAPPACSALAARDMLDYVASLKNPEHVADLVSCAVLRGAARRQRILETLNIETRLRQLILFLQAEIKEHGNAKHEHE